MLNLFTNAATSDSTTLWNDTAPTSTVFTVGDSGTAERRLSLLFPLESQDSSDAIETSTYAFGKLNCLFSDINSLSSNDIFQVSVAATDILSEDSNFNAEEPLDATDIINLSGNSLFIDNGEVLWSTQSSDAEHSLNTEFDFDNTNYKISAWNKPNSFDSFALIFRLKGINTTSFLPIQTNINSMSLLQYTIFENALNEEFYLDTVGRANLPEDVIDEHYKYTNQAIDNDKIVIENPADVIYHFLEKELLSIDKMNRDSWITARENNISIDIAVSVNDKINSKKLIEDISRNSMLYPKYDSYGTFSFSNIKPTYNESDYEMQSKDIISYSFKRTPIEDIITLANVKFKKDYAEDE